MTESACLTFTAGALGVLLASLTLDTLVALSPAYLPVSGGVDIDWRVLAFTFALCAIASAISGVLPALHSGRQSVAHIASGTRHSGSRRMLRFQHGLMVTQIALGVALLAAGGLLAHSLFRLSSVDPGFRTKGTMGFELAFPSGRPEESLRIYRRVLDATRSAPGVISAGWITSLPPETRAGVFTSFSILGEPVAAPRTCNFQTTSEDFFFTAGVPVIRGRDFTPADSETAPAVAIVNETLARQYFSGLDPIGRRIAPAFNGRREREIVGIIRDMRDRGLDAKPIATVYVPFRQSAQAYGSIMARTSAPPESLLAEIRRRVTLAEPGAPLRNLSTIETRLAKTLDAPRFYAVIAVACAIMATLFVTLGLYGVISYGVSRRTFEIGIRMALGAAREEILRSVLWNALRMAGIGVALGVAVSVAGARLLTTLLFEIKPVDPVTLAIAGGVVAVVSLASSYLPARRASLVEPVIALRQD